MSVSPVRNVGALRKDIEFCVCGSWTGTKNISFLPSQSFLLIVNECEFQINTMGIENDVT